MTTLPAAAVELVLAGDQLRKLAQTGRATRPDRDRRNEAVALYLAARLHAELLDRMATREASGT